jgi:hypothetical protein
VGALEAAAAYTGGRATVPAWVRKVVARNGTHNFSGMSDKGDGKVTATNLAPYAGKKATTFLPSLFAKRALDIGRAWKSENRAQQIIDQFNKGQAAA